MRLALVCGLTTLSAVLAVADEPDPNAPKRFTLTPKAAPLRALQYPLLPELAEQTSGNAATFYKKAFDTLKSTGGNNETQERRSKSLEVPLKGFPREEVRGILKLYGEAFKEAEAGACCETCDWKLAERLRKQGIGASVDELHDSRRIALFLAARARLELADGHPERAIGTLRSGFALGRHLGDNPTLIGALVGMYVTGMMLDRLEEVVQHEKAANLYWSLTTLPSPFIDLRKPLQGERVSWYGSLPGIRDAAFDLNAGPLEEKELREAAKFVEVIRFDTPLDPFNPMHFLLRAKIGQEIQKKHESSKRALIEQGRPKEKVEAMPHLQVALLHSCLQYDRLLDDLAKWQSFPYWEAQAQLQAGAKRQKEELDGTAADAPAIPLAKLLLSSLEKILVSRVRVDRRIASLRCVEAIRLYAAAHGGKLPAELKDIKEVPVPLDPVTGKPFTYENTSEKAVLSCEPNPDDWYLNRLTIRYELTLKR